VVKARESEIMKRNERIKSGVSLIKAEVLLGISSWAIIIASVPIGIPIRNWTTANRTSSTAGNVLAGPKKDEQEQEAGDFAFRQCRESQFQCN